MHIQSLNFLSYNLIFSNINGIFFHGLLRIYHGIIRDQFIVIVLSAGACGTSITNHILLGDVETQMKTQDDLSPEEGFKL